MNGVPAVLLTGWRLPDFLTRQAVGCLARTRKPNSSLFDKGKRSGGSEGATPDCLTSGSHVRQSRVRRRVANCWKRSVPGRAGCVLQRRCPTRSASWSGLFNNSPRARAIANPCIGMHQPTAGSRCAHANSFPRIGQAADGIGVRPPMTERAPPEDRGAAGPRAGSGPGSSATPPLTEQRPLRPLHLMCGRRDRAELPRNHGACGPRSRDLSQIPSRRAPKPARTSLERISDEPTADPDPRRPR